MPRKKQVSNESHDLARRCAAATISKKGRDVIILDLRPLTDITDFFVIATAANDVQLKAIADAVLDDLVVDGIKPYRTEGWGGGQWIILDFVEVVVHVMYHEAREFYKIERLWADAAREEVADERVEH